MRRRLPAGVRMYTGDDFNYAELIAGDEQGYSDALLGIFDAIAPAPSPRWRRSTRGRPGDVLRDPRPTVPLSRHIFRRRPASTRPASCSSPTSTATRSTSRWSAARRARARSSTSPSCSGSADARRAARRDDPAARRRSAGGAAGDVHGVGADAIAVSSTAVDQHATVRQQWSCGAGVDGCARHGIHGDRAVARPGRRDRARPRRTRIRDAGLAVTGYCRGGMFPAADAAAAGAAIDDNRRAIDEAATLGAEGLVLVGGGLPAGSTRTSALRARRSRDGIAAVLPHARAAGMPLAIEPLHPMYAADRACVNTLEQALDLCDRSIRPGGVGVAIDVYHVWWDPDLERADRARRPRRILAFHVCDWLVPTTDLLIDRGMMGDGVIDIPAIRGMIEAAGYDGPIEVEIFSSERHRAHRLLPDRGAGAAGPRRHAVRQRRLAHRGPAGACTRRGAAARTRRSAIRCRTTC